MKKMILLCCITAMMLATGCSKDDNNNGSGCISEYSCFECTNCQGNYGHLIDGEYCVDGYDNCEDWETAKVNYETNDGCDCEYTQ
ncbi:MAG: hypothetical protein WC994_02685 [Brumimicrobium sp.]